MIDQGEAILAIVGLSNALQGEVPRWTQARQRELDKLDKEIADLATDLIDGKIHAKPVPVPDNYDFFLELLREPISHEDLRTIVNIMPDEETAIAFIGAIQNAFAHLKEIFPVSEHFSFMGVENIKPSVDVEYKFYQQLSTLDDPKGMFNSIGSGGMLRSQTKVMRMFYPSMSNAIDQAIYDAIAVKKRSNPLYRLPEVIETGLANWMDRRTIDHESRPMPAVVPPHVKTGGRPNVAVSLSPSERITDGGMTRK